MPAPPSGKPKALISTWIAPAIISVMIARYNPRMRSAGRPTIRPTIAAATPPASNAISNGTPRPCEMRSANQPPTPSRPYCASDTMPSWANSRLALRLQIASATTLLKVRSQ